MQVKRIHVVYKLKLEDAALADAAQRAHEVHHRGCPVYRTIGSCVEITTELQIEP